MTDAPARGSWLPHGQRPSIGVVPRTGSTIFNNDAERTSNQQQRHRSQDGPSPMAANAPKGQSTGHRPCAASAPVPNMYMPVRLGWLAAWSCSGAFRLRPGAQAICTRHRHCQEKARPAKTSHGRRGRIMHAKGTWGCRLFLPANVKRKPTYNTRSYSSTTQTG